MERNHGALVDQCIALLLAPWFPRPAAATIDVVTLLAQTSDSGVEVACITMMLSISVFVLLQVLFRGRSTVGMTSYNS